VAGLIEMETLEFQRWIIKNERRTANDKFCQTEKYVAQRFRQSAIEEA
jgi:hypothetical protein